MGKLFAGTLLLSSSLLFFLEPLCANMLLPTLGGTPAVWNTCLVFFQAQLLLGYCYAHFGTRWLGVKRHLVLHLLLLIGAFVSLPVLLRDDVAPPTLPIVWLLQTLTLGVGLPFFVLASSAPCCSAGTPERPAVKTRIFFTQPAIWAASRRLSFIPLSRSRI